MSEEKKEMTPFVPPSQVSPAELMKAFQEEGVIEAPPAEAPKPVEAKPEKAPEPEKKPAPKEELPAILRIAKERDALRKEEERLKPHVEALKVFSPQELARLAQARASGNPKEALRALGFSHEEYNASVLADGAPEKKEEKAAAPNADIETLKQELAALKQEREMEKTRSARSQALDEMQKALADDKWAGEIDSLDDLEGVEAILVDFHQRTGSLPGDTFKESVELAAEEYVRQRKLAKERRETTKWRKQALTAAATSVPVPEKAPDSRPSPGTASPRTLTNANTTAPAAPRATPKTRQEILEALIEGRLEDLPT